MTAILSDIITIQRARFIALRCRLFHRKYHVQAWAHRYLGCSCTKCGHRFTGDKLP